MRCLFHRADIGDEAVCGQSCGDSSFKQGGHGTDWNGEDEEVGLTYCFCEIRGGVFKPEFKCGRDGGGLAEPDPDFGFPLKSERDGATEEASSQDADSFEGLVHEKDRTQGVGPGRGKISEVIPRSSAYGTRKYFFSEAG